MSSQSRRQVTHSQLRIVVPGALMLAMIAGASAPARAQSELAKLRAAPGEIGESFGCSVAVYRTRAVIGALENSDNGEDGGAAYVFKRIDDPNTYDPNGNGTWVQEAQLLAFDGDEFDHFGSSVGISQYSAVIGAPSDDPNQTGSAYVFRRVLDPNEPNVAWIWVTEDKLLASDGAPWDRFGDAAAISLDPTLIGAETAVIGAPHDTPISRTGSAYVFRRTPLDPPDPNDPNAWIWVEEDKLVASDAAAGAVFGYSVSVSGHVAVVGAPALYDPNGGTGSAYVFRRDPSGLWIEEDKLLASDGASGDLFGFSVALRGNTAVIGACCDDDPNRGLDAGSAYVFRCDPNGVWSEQAKLLASDGASGDLFGFSVGIRHDIAVVGARDDDDPNTNAGSAYSFRRDPNGAWVEESKLLASDGGLADYFGSSLAFSAGVALIGAPYNRDPNAGPGWGSAYVFGGGWSQGDIDSDGDTDWADLAILLVDYNCLTPNTCVADLDDDGNANLVDLAHLLAHFALPPGLWVRPDNDGGCDTNKLGPMTLSVVPVDNSSVDPNDDPLEPGFNGGVTHYTFDLQVTVDPDEDWCAAGADAVITEPGAEFFRHALDTGGSPVDPNFFAFWPALEFDSYWCGASVILPGGSGTPGGAGVEARTATELSVSWWYDIGGGGGGTFTIARYTIAVPRGSGATPLVVPMGTGGDDTVVGTITGWATHASYDPGCNPFDFDIVLHCDTECVADIDNDCDTDWSDLAIMLADYGCTSNCVADITGDDQTDLSDLGTLLAEWPCGDGDPSCDEPGPDVFTVSVVPVENTSVGLNDDPLEPGFNGGATHFTFDLQIEVEPGEDWGAGAADALLTGSGVEFFRHTVGSGDAPDPGVFAAYPALEFDSYWCGASVIPPGGSGDPGYPYLTTRTATQLSASWYDLDDPGNGTFTIARYTIVVPPGVVRPPKIVPSGTGGDPVIGTIEGWITNASYTPGCSWFYFDITYCKPLDVPARDIDHIAPIGPVKPEPELPAPPP